MLLEKHTPSPKGHWRAYQDQSVVPFEDGTELVFTAGRIALRANEWFRVWQVVETFEAFLACRAEPPFIRWRDISDVLEGPHGPDR